MAYRPSFGFGRKLAATVFVALLAGFAWAWIERKGLRFDASPSTKSEPKKESRAPATDAGKRESTSKKEGDPTTRRDPGSNSDPTPTIPEAKLGSIFRSAEDHVEKARYQEAWALIAEVKEIQIASDSWRSRLRTFRERVQNYLRLIRETQRGGTIRMPEMTRLHLRTRGRIVARRLSEDASRYHFEDIRGFRGSIAKDEVERSEKLDEYAAFVEIWAELVRRASNAGVKAVDEKVNEVYVYRFEDLPNRKPAGWQYFDLADYCASNGSNELVTPLFDQALRHDSAVIGTVHEKKGERLVDVLFYFLSIHSLPDAEFALTKVLIPQYSDTRAYRERVLQDADARDLIAKVLKQEVKFTTPEKPREDSPPPTRTDEPVRETRRDPPGLSPMPGDAVAAVRAKVEEGDRAFRKGTEHLLNSDPNANPDGWAGENRRALDFFRQAAAAYEAAQNLYSDSAKIPQALLDRFRDAQMRMSLCRKRAVSGK